MPSVTGRLGACRRARPSAGPRRLAPCRPARAPGRRRVRTSRPSTLVTMSPPIAPRLLLERRAPRAGPQAASVGRAARHDHLDPGAAVGAQVEAVVELRVDLPRSRRRGTGSSTLPVSRSWSSERCTTSTGTAKPTPLPAPDDERICELMPEHAAAGVEQRAARVAAVDRRVGLQRAGGLEAGERLDRRGRSPRSRRSTASAPRRTASRSRRPARRPSTSSIEPSASGCSVSPFGSTLTSATSENGSKPTISAATWLPSPKRTKTSPRLADRRALAGR